MASSVKPRPTHTLAWDTRDLVRRLCHALEIAAHTIDRLAATGYTDPHEPSNNLRPEKIIAETGLLLLAASTAAHHEDVRAPMAQLAQRLVPYARSDRMLLGICLEPSVALEYAQAHVCLSRIGHRDPRVDALLQQSVDAHAHAGRERPPHRMLEQEWTLRGWQAALQRDCRPGNTARMSVLNHPMDLLTSSREDVYAFTHALMYVTDFNLVPQRLPRSRAAILADAEAALARCLDDQDYDLAGEVLLAWPLTGTSWTPAGAFGFRVLARVEDDAGFLPAPSTRLDRAARLSEADRGDYLLATAYHTAYVMGLLCAAALQPERAPPRTLPVERPRGHRGPEPLLAWLDARGPRQHWRDDLDRLAPSERAATTSLLFNIALRRAVSRRAFAELPDLLELGVALGLAGLPAARQAAELLVRLGTCSSILPSRGGDLGDRNAQRGEGDARATCAVDARSHRPSVLA